MFNGRAADPAGAHTGGQTATPVRVLRLALD
jgi:hypothetical protein